MYNIRDIDIIGLGFDDKLALMNLASSIPKHMRDIISIYQNDFINDIIQSRKVLQVDVSSILTSILSKHNNIRVINDPNFSDVDSAACILKHNLINMGFSKETNSSLVLLIDSECYDTESFGNFDELCSSVILKMKHKVTFKYAEIIKFINEIIVPFKILQMYKTEELLERISKRYISILDPEQIMDKRLEIINNLLIKCINSTDYDDVTIAKLLYLYRNMLNPIVSVDRYMEYIDICKGEHINTKIRPILQDIESSDVTFNMVFESLPSKLLNDIKAEYNVNSKVQKSQEYGTFCESVGNILFFGDNISDPISTDSIIAMINKISIHKIKEIMNSDVSFEIGEKELTKLYGLGMDLVNTMIRLPNSEFQKRVILVYDSLPYILFQKMHNKNIYAITKLDNRTDGAYHIINISDDDYDYSYKLEL